MQISSSDLSGSHNVKRQKFGISAFVFLMLFGALFGGAGLFALKSAQIDESWSRTQGKVVDVSSRISDGSTMHTAVVEYKVDGSSHRVTAGSSSSVYPSIGSVREVAYDPAHPNNAKVAEGWGIKTLLWAFPVIGLFCIILAPILFSRSLRRSARIEQLMRTGQRLQGVLVDIQSTGNDNNTNTYKITVSAADSTGVVSNYTSDKLGGVAGLAMADFRNNPIPVDVYVDATNPEHYYVDISDIPNLTPQRINELIQSVISRQQSAAGAQTVAPAQQLKTTPPNLPIASTDRAPRAD